MLCKDFLLSRCFPSRPYCVFLVFLLLVVLMFAVLLLFSLLCDRVSLVLVLLVFKGISGTPYLHSVPTLRSYGL